MPPPGYKFKKRITCAIKECFNRTNYKGYYCEEHGKEMEKNLNKARKAINKLFQ